jgi:Cu+-exporting ATPase
MTLWLALIVLGGGEKPLTCPVMGGSVDMESTPVEYAGAEFRFCCAGCDSQFVRAPAKYIAQQAKAKHASGVFLFDPVSRERLDPSTAIVASRDCAGIRFRFASAENLKRFDLNPQLYATAPAKESLVCPVTREVVNGFAKAAAYADYKGNRYFFCTKACPELFRADPEKYAPAVASALRTPAVRLPQAASAPGTFICKHCGWPIVTKSDADLKEKCAICKCGKSNGECRPAGE